MPQLNVLPDDLLRLFLSAVYIFSLHLTSYFPCELMLANIVSHIDLCASFARLIYN